MTLLLLGLLKLIEIKISPRYQERCGFKNINLKRESSKHVKYHLTAAKTHSVLPSLDYLQSADEHDYLFTFQ